MVLDFEKNPQGAILLQRKFASGQEEDWLTVQRLRQYKTLDLSRIITTFVLHHTFSERLVYNYVVPFKKNVIIPMHHWLGRMLLVLVYVQMYLGVRLLNLDPFVVYCFYGWIAVLVLLLLYKEVVYQRKSRRMAKCAPGGKKAGGGCCGRSGRRRGQTVEDEAIDYTRKFMRNKRRHEQEILSLHNFVGTPLCKRKRLAAEKKLSADENTNNIIVDADSEPLGTLEPPSERVSADSESKDGDSKSTGVSEELMTESEGGAAPALSKV